MSEQLLSKNDRQSWVFVPKSFVFEWTSDRGGVLDYIHYGTRLHPIRLCNVRTYSRNIQVLQHS